MIAILFTIGIIGVSKLENAGIINKPITQLVSTGEDFLAMKKWVASMMNDSNKIAVMADPQFDEPLATYESMQPYKDGVIVSYVHPLPINAQDNGLVLFTGFTRQTGKTMTVHYDNGDVVTYGYVGSFLKLPYTSVKKGDTLALMDEGAIFLKVKRDGVNLDASVIPAFLSGLVD